MFYRLSISVETARVLAKLLELLGKLSFTLTQLSLEPLSLFVELAAHSLQCVFLTRQGHTLLLSLLLARDQLAPLLR